MSLRSWFCRSSVRRSPVKTRRTLHLEPLESRKLCAVDLSNTVEEQFVQAETFVMDTVVDSVSGYFWADEVPTGQEPIVQVHDQLTGQVRNLQAFQSGFTGGVRVAVADVNGDGVDDIICAAGRLGEPHVRVFDGRSLNQLAGAIGSFYAYDKPFTGGLFVAAADIDGDGLADLVTGADRGGGPHVRVFSGADGHVLFERMVFEMPFTGGLRIATGDISGDGVPDVVCAAGLEGGPRVSVLDGTTGLPVAGPLGDFFVADESRHGGLQVAVGDVDGDGDADVITSLGPNSRAPADMDQLLSSAARDSYLFIHSGRTGEHLSTFKSDRFHVPLVQALDLDHNGKAEVLLKSSATQDAPADYVPVYLNGQPVPTYLTPATVDSVFASDEPLVDRLDPPLLP